MNSSSQTSPNLDLVLDVSVNVSVELGQCEMTMRDILQLAPGSVVQLDRAANAPVDLFVNQRLIARGEIVVVGERFGIKITEIVSGQP